MRQNKNGDWNNKRTQQRKIPIGKAVLMVYCGKCTEPDYFGKALQQIRQNQKKESLGITDFMYKEKVLPIDPKGMANNVESIMKSYSEICFDEVYVVFDKDSFKDDNFDNAIIKINELN